MPMPTPSERLSQGSLYLARKRPSTATLPFGAVDDAVLGEVDPEGLFADLGIEDYID